MRPGTRDSRRHVRCQPPQARAAPPRAALSRPDVAACLLRVAAQATSMSHDQTLRPASAARQGRPRSTVAACRRSPGPAATSEPWSWSQRCAWRPTSARQYRQSRQVASRISHRPSTNASSGLDATRSETPAAPQTSGRLDRPGADARSGRATVASAVADATPAMPGGCERQAAAGPGARTSSGAGVCGCVGTRSHSRVERSAAVSSSDSSRC